VNVHHRKDFGRDGGALRYASLATVLRQARPALQPPDRIVVSEAAAKYRRISNEAYNGPWRNDVAPYMIEPMDMSTSRRFRCIGFAGPARTAKTDALVLNVIAHRVICQPRKMLVVHIGRNEARDFSLEKLGPMIRATPEVGRRQLPGRANDNIFDKRFQGGMRLSVGYPVIGQLSARDLPDVLFTDYDRMTENVDGEGSPFSLGRKRTQTFGSLGKVIAESSPGRPILDEDWKPSVSEPHRAPPCTGILAIYNEGTRGRWYWPCRECKGEFEPDFSILHFAKAGSAADRAATVTAACPHCGAIYEHRHKTELNQAGRWLHEGRNGQLMPIGDMDRDVDTASYWMKGTAAAFQDWRQLTLTYLNAVEHYRLTGDEQNLKTTINVDQGLPYLPRNLSGSDVTLDFLKGKAAEAVQKVAPAQARFITVAVDVQSNRFVVQVEAWGEGLERWLIDRFDIHTPPEGAPNADDRAIDPARFPEDWEALFPLLEQAYPVAGTDCSLQPVALIADSGGAAGVTSNAYAFYRKARKDGFRRRVFIAKGQPGFDRPRALEKAPEKVGGQRRRKGQAPSDLLIVNVGTDVLKDEVLAALARNESGQITYHIPGWIDEAVLKEFTAERRTDKGYRKKEGQVRNEALDLAVYGRALAIVLRAEKINWQAPPDWARTVPENSFSVIAGASPEPDPVPVSELPAEVQPDEPAAQRVKRRAGSWIGGRRKWF